MAIITTIGVIMTAVMGRLGDMERSLFDRFIAELDSTSTPNWRDFSVTRDGVPGEVYSAEEIYKESVSSLQSLIWHLSDASNFDTIYQEANNVSAALNAVINEMTGAELEAISVMSAAGMMAQTGLVEIDKEGRVRPTEACRQMVEDMERELGGG